MFELSGLDLLDLTLCEQLWPMESRKIYCSITGRHWGMITEDYVRDTVKIFGSSNRKELEKIIDQMIVVSGPSPLWQSKIPNMLAHNKHADPAGFLVYMISDLLKKNYTESKGGSLDFEIAWRREKIAAYSAFSAMPEFLVKDMNDLLLVMSSEGSNPTTQALKDRKISDYITEKSLKDLAVFLRDTRRRFNNSKHRPMAGSQAVGHSVHLRTLNKTASLEGITDEAVRQNIVDLMVGDIFKSLDIQFDDKANKRAKSLFGDDKGATYTILEKMQVDHIAQVKARGTSTYVTPNPAPFAKAEAGQKLTFSFGKKG